MQAQTVDLDVVGLIGISRQVLEALVGRAEDFGHWGSPLVPVVSVRRRAPSRPAVVLRRTLYGCPRMWLQRELTLDPRPRGFHLITREVLAALPELSQLSVGMLHLLLRHTSASLTLNENASPEVRRDLDAWFADAVPERSALWTHTLEGPDDMPAHIKASLLGATLLLPLGRGTVLLGSWQGIYLCEHR